MERLTNKREADAQREEYERRLANGYPRNIPEERFLRLAAYEDSDCEPEEVLPKDKADEIALKLMRLADLESLCSYNRLRELAEADKDGRLVVPPCKVGDVLYRASPSGVVVHRVVNVVYRGLTSRWYIDTIPNLPYASEELGKTTFLTREEAEKALGAKKDG
nr:MAG TPA: hypothetical protein [Caudoviricetes sp.]